MLLALAAALAFQAEPPPPPIPARVDASLRGEAAILEVLEAAELRFIYEWRDAFRLSIDKRTGPADPRYDYWIGPGFGGASAGAASLRDMPPDLTAQRRLGEAYSHCHPDARPFVWGMAAVPESRVISSATSGRVFCPSWALSDSLHYDASLVVDNAVELRYRAAVWNGRASLIRVFESAERAIPSNEWIVGQLVRLHIDQRDLDRALVVAKRCGASEVWCAQLLGYVHTQRGDWADADRAFHATARAMSPRERCAWTDASVLLDSIARRHYVAIPCNARDSVNAVIWWLSDPLYLDPGNERRAEQFARKVGIALRSGLERDERYDWRAITGGDGMAEMVERYGWPSYSYWAYGQLGSAIDMSTARLDTAFHLAYTTFEYTGGRLQTVPAPRAILDPLNSTSADWSIADPRKPVPQVTYRDDRVAREFARLASTVSEWWPHQHFAPRTPLAQIRDGQVAFLRREESAILATANDIAPGDFGEARRTISGTLMVTTHPDTLRVVAQSQSTVGAPLVLFGPVDTRRSLAAIEFPAAGTAGPAGGRTRFGVTPPASLASMRPGDLAISDVVVLMPPANAAEYPRETERVLAFMAGSMTISRSRRLGVYWETYGFAPDDSVELAVWIERFTPQGVLRRFGIALNIATDRNTPVAQSWAEARLGRNAYVIPGRIPIVGRSIVLDVSALTPGEYWVDIVARKPGRDPVRSRRTLVVSER